MSQLTESPRTGEPVVEGGASSPESPRVTMSPSGVLEKTGLLIIFVLMIGVFCVLRPDTFATTANFQAIATTQSVLAVLGLALIIPLVGGRFDVSVGSTLGLTSILSAGLMSNHDWPLIGVIVLAVIIGVVIGTINGVIVAYLGVNSLIATLGIGTILGGVIQAYSNGIPITSGLSPALTDLGDATILGIPTLFVLTLVLAAIVWFGLTQMRLGRLLFAVGSNLTAAELSGIRVRRLVMSSFIASGVIAGIGGVLQIAASGSGDPTIGGVNFIVPAIAAVFLGATTLQPGRYNVPGMILGLFFVGVTVSGLTLVGAASWVTAVFNGAAVVIAIIVSAQFRRRRTGAMSVGD